MFNRRHFLRLAAMGISYPAISNVIKTYLPFVPRDIILTDEALRIHRSAIVVDGNNDG